MPIWKAVFTEIKSMNAAAGKNSMFLPVAW